MTALTDRTPKDTYKDLLQVSNSNSGIDGTRRNISDGEGTNAPVKVSTSAAEFTGIVDLSAASLLIAADAILFSNIDWSGTDSLTGEIDVASGASIDFLSGSTLTLATGSTFTVPADFIPLSKIDLSGDDTIGGALTVASGSSITFVSGSTLTLATGSSLDVTASTLTLRDDQIPLAKVDLSGDDTLGGALSVASGSSITFASGSSLTVDGNATVSIPGLLAEGGLLSTASGTSVSSSDLGVTSPSIIHLALDQVTFDGTNDLLVQIGDAGGIETTGYEADGASVASGGNGTVNSTAGFIIDISVAARAFSGTATLVNVTGNIWVFGYAGRTGSGIAATGGGRKELSGALTQILLKPSGSDNFDGGQVRIRGQ